MQSLARNGTAPIKLLTRHPVLVAALGVIAIVTMWLGSLLSAVGVVIGVCVVMAIVVHRPRVYRALDRSAQRRAWRHRCEARESRLEDAGIFAYELDEATRLVREVMAQDAVLASHLELEGLLDHLVEVAIRSRRCERALEATQRATSGGTRLRCELGERQARTRSELQQRLRSYRNELESIPELLCLVLQRTVVDAMVTTGDAVGDRLALCDELAETVPALAADQ
jgi:hypothetical protein